MADYANAPLSVLFAEITADGIVDAAEVAGIRSRLYADGVIDREEAEFLFAINDVVTGKQNDPGWQDLFVEAITSHVLEDEQSPGVVDDAEAAWLIEKIEGDQQVDDVEKALLASLKKNAKGMPDSLRAKIQAAGM
jgi:hypothetical protein